MTLQDVTNIPIPTVPKGITSEGLIAVVFVVLVGVMLAIVILRQVPSLIKPLLDATQSTVLLSGKIESLISELQGVRASNHKIFETMTGFQVQVMDLETRLDMIEERMKTIDRIRKQNRDSEY